VVCPSEVCPSEMCPSEVCPSEVCPSVVYPSEVCQCDRGASTRMRLWSTTSCCAVEKYIYINRIELTIVTIG
jgi:hypothetical protein